MASLRIKPAATCRYDLLSLGEIMLRLDPGEGRIRTTREFRVWKGGGEDNVARGLRRNWHMHKYARRIQAQRGKTGRKLSHPAKG